jgi:hypothetical protein
MKKQEPFWYCQSCHKNADLQMRITVNVGTDTNANEKSNNLLDKPLQAQRRRKTKKNNM